MNQTAGVDPNDPENLNRQQTASNMTTLEQDLKKQILGRSKAEKTFRPWWDTLEDYLLNSLVLLGKYICKQVLSVSQVLASISKLS